MEFLHADRSTTPGDVHAGTEFATQAAANPKKERGLDRDYMHSGNQSRLDFVEGYSKQYSKSDKNLGGRKASCAEEVAKGKTTGAKGSSKGKSVGVSRGFEHSKEGTSFSKFGASKHSGPIKPHTAGSHMGLAYKQKGQFHVSIEEARATSHPPSPEKKPKISDWFLEGVSCIVNLSRAFHKDKLYPDISTISHA